MSREIFRTKMWSLVAWHSDHGDISKSKSLVFPRESYYEYDIGDEVRNIFYEFMTSWLMWLQARLRRPGYHVVARV